MARAVEQHEATVNSPDDRIWDLRQGDTDDDRASPYGRGWRALLVSTALEFNFLTATIAFFMIVIVPVLLVGLTPPLILIYSRQKLDATAAISSHPLAALLTIAALIAVGWRIGQPLLTMAIDNLWHLHYTLVFPMFVGLRESISALMEHLAGETRASDDLDRRRRLGALIAATLLAGAALLVAVGVGEVERPALEDVMRQPWALLRAGVRNALILLSVSTAAASLFWLWREFTSRRPLRDWAPGPPIHDAPIVRVAHLSDLHLVGERYGYRMESGTHGPSGNACMREALDKLGAIHAATPLDCVLVTGDVTDAGTRSEWIELIDLLQTYPDIRSRVLFVPGNHDVNIVDRTNTGRFDLPWSISHALRRLRFVVALDDIQGERVHIVDGVSGGLGPSLRAYLQDGNRPMDLRGLAERGSWRGRSAIAKVWEEIFPLIAPPKPPDGCGAILLDSNARSHFSATNAIGVISRSQLRKLRRVLTAFPDHAWLILLHHHVVEYPVDAVKLSARIGLSLMNATDLLSVIARHASRVVIFHGHRHHDWIGTKGDVVLCSAPSVTLGSVGPNRNRGSFHVNELALVGGGLVRLTSSESVLVS
jgi:3',5'-cyclic AMP phosphodiesterase CpdA